MTIKDVPPLTAIGFCSKCGIVREDYRGIPVTDCVCTAKRKHKDDCMYVKAVGMWIEIDDIRCDAHKNFPCEECDCTCGAHAASQTSKEEQR